MTLALVTIGLLVAQAAPPPATVTPGDRVVVTVTNDQQTIRGRISEVTPDALVLDDDGTRVRLPLATVHQVDRAGDSLWNGSAIGAALGGGSAIAAMARTCGNTNCADTSASLDPRLTLLGTLVGAGIGALIDAAIDGHETVYRAGSEQCGNRSGSPGLETYLHILHVLHGTWRDSRRRAVRSLPLSLERGQPRVRCRLRRARHARILDPERPHARPEQAECVQLRTTHSGRGIPLLIVVPRCHGPGCQSLGRDRA